MPSIGSINRIPPAPVNLVVDEESPSKQGIVAILRPDCDRPKAAASIRRTLSADMSSRKWLAQNGFSSPLKKNVSSEVLVQLPAANSDTSSSEGEEDFEKRPRQDDVWRSIQKERSEMQRPMDFWGSILLCQKSDDKSCLPPPYVPPLAKRSAGALSEKSLEICTESLGSETNSDCFSSYPPSEASSDADEGKEDGQRVVRKETNPFGDLHVSQHKKSPAPRAFPPLLPSIGAAGEGASLRMQSHRENGRLVVEAVSVPPRNNFQAQRRDGRLLLTLVGSPSAVAGENEVAEFETVFGNMEEVGGEIEEDDDGGGGEEEETVAKEKEFEVEERLRSLPSGMTTVHKMQKLMAIGNKNRTAWSNEDQPPTPQSLPLTPPREAQRIPPQPPTAAASLNACEYFWRNKTAASGGFITPTVSAHLKNELPNNNGNKIDCIKGYEHQDLVVTKGNRAEYVFADRKGCKEARSESIREPYWIATS